MFLLDARSIVCNDRLSRISKPYWHCSTRYGTDDQRGNTIYECQDLDEYNYTTTNTSSAVERSPVPEASPLTDNTGLGFDQSTPPVLGPPLLSNDASNSMISTMEDGIEIADEGLPAVTRPPSPFPPPPPRYNETCNYTTPYEPFPDGQESLVSSLIDEFAARPGEMRNYQSEWKHQRDKEVRSFEIRAQCIP